VTAIGRPPVDLAADSRRAHEVFLAQVAIFAIGALSGLQIANFTVTFLSVVCLALVPGFLLMSHRGLDLLPLALAAFGWISFLASGLVHGVSALWPNAVAPAAFSLYLIGLTVLTGRKVEWIATVLAGIGTGTVVFFLTKGIELTHTGNFLDLWKYGIAHGVTIVLLFVLIRAKAHPLVPAVVLAVLGLASLGLNFRSHALVCLLAGATLFANRFLGARVRRGWQFVGIIVFGLVFANTMPIVARAGWFGPALQRKTIDQEAIDLPLLLAGRTEPPMTLTAIMERPFLGWGSAMKMTPDVYAQAEHLAVRTGFSPTFPFYLYWRLPPSDYSAMHSILLGSWAEGGLLAVLLPVWLLVACVAVVWNNTRYGVWAPLVLTVALQGIWDMWYAPWTYNMVPEFACIALLFCAAGLRGRAAVP
jgi:hypothetical protein